MSFQPPPLEVQSEGQRLIARNVTIIGKFPYVKGVGVRGGYCEVKSLFDPGVLQDPPEGVMAVRKDLPFYRKLGQNVRGAVERLNAENPDHDKPNVIVFVSHTPEIERKDLIATIAGLPVSDGERLFMLGRKMQGQVCEAARKVDLIIWIDATTGICQHLTVADARHRATALGLFDLPE